MEENQNPTQPVSNPEPPVQPVSELGSSSQTPPPQNPIKKTSKLSLKAIISTIIFFLLAGGAAAGYVYREPLMKLVTKPTPTPSPIVTITPTPTPDSTLKKYENAEYKISFDYPEESKLEEKKEDNYLSVNLSNGCFVFHAIPALTKSLNNTSIDDIYANLSRFDALPTDKSLSFSSTTSNSTAVTTTYMKRPNTVIGGEEWRTLDVTNDFENHGTKTYYFHRSSTASFLIYSYIGGPCANTDGTNNTSSKILSTFKFTN